MEEVIFSMFCILSNTKAKSRNIYRIFTSYSIWSNHHIPFLAVFLIFLCVCVHVLHAYGLMCVGIHAHRFACMWKPEVDVRNHFPFLIDWSKFSESNSALTDTASLGLRILFLPSKGRVAGELPHALSTLSGFWSSCLYGKYFNLWTISWFSCLYFSLDWVLFGKPISPWLERCYLLSHSEWVV